MYHIFNVLIYFQPEIGIFLIKEAMDVVGLLKPMGNAKNDAFRCHGVREALKFCSLKSVYLACHLLAIITTLANFKSLGTVPDKNAVLNSIFSDADKTYFNSLRCRLIC